LIIDPYPKKAGMLMLSFRIEKMKNDPQRLTKGVQRGERFEIIVDGRRIDAYEGETIGAAIMAAGLGTLRYSKKRNEPRGIYCGIGLCQECRMVINGIPNTQACKTLATPECKVESGQPDKREGV
jgi:sarcosine oxidase subunit alpha